jgi:hypothetical protein
MSELELIVRMAIPAAAIVLLVLAWPVLKSWEA